MVALQILVLSVQVRILMYQLCKILLYYEKEDIKFYCLYTYALHNILVLGNINVYNGFSSIKLFYSCFYNRSNIDISMLFGC